MSIGNLSIAVSSFTTRNKMLHFLAARIGRFGPTESTPTFPDLVPIDYFVRYFKQKVGADSLNNSIHNWIILYIIG